MDNYIAGTVVNKAIKSKLGVQKPLFIKYYHNELKEVFVKTTRAV